uniref:PLAT domain-containing protein n=1 Tax=Arcella intermedia TaxID=1963864 RepID=A0A6B2KWS8_9EUKA
MKVLDLKKERLITYKVSVTTSNEKGSGTDANVKICLVGQKGETGIRSLDSDKDDFEQGKTDHFFIEAEDIGPLKKIKVGLESGGNEFISSIAGSDWKCSKITIEDPKRGTYVFNIDKWFKMKEWKEFDSQEPQLTSGVSYIVEITTGNIKGAGTSAKVYIDVIGDKNSTGKQILDNSPTNFNRGSKDTFTIDTVELGELKKIIVGHDNAGFGADWFLENVSITNERTSKQWHFGCGCWLSKSLDDKQTEKEFTSSSKPKKVTTYEVSVKTGSNRGSGTDANVFIEIKGKKLTSGKRKLDNMWNNFEAGQTDKFLIESIDVGTVKSIIIGHDNTGVGPGWYVDWISVVNLSRKKTYNFPVSRWFAKDEDDGLIERTLAPGEGDASGQSLYQVSVVTGNIRGAGTDANVFIEVFGKKGKSRKQVLDNSENNFEKGKTDVFVLKGGNDLGELTKIHIGHDNSGFGPGWFLEKVIVKNMKTNEEAFFFAGRWLAKDEGDGATEIDVAACKEDGTSSAPIVSYKVFVTTGDRRGAGTDANVFITLFGTKGDSSERLLESPGNNFERNSTDTFGFYCVDLGELTKINIRHDNSGFGPGWFLDTVVVESGVGQTFYFPCGHWLAKDEEDKQISRDIVAVTSSPEETYNPLVVYRAFVTTGDLPGAGTSSPIYITLFGKLKQSEELRLDSSLKSAFDRNETTEIALQTEYLGPLTKISLRIEPGGLLSFSTSWFLDKIRIVSEKDKESYFFLCGQWFEKSTLSRDISASTADGATYAKMVTYTIHVTTGRCRGAGTDANVFIIMYGEKDNSGRHLLDGPISAFEKGTTDVFRISSTDLGALKKIRLGHDGKGIGSGWFCESVTIECSAGGSWNFPCRRWFDVDEDDHQIERDLVVNGTPGRAIVTYRVSVITGLEKGAGTDANVFITIEGTEGRVDKAKLDNDKDNFERGRIDVFPLTTLDLGEIKQITIGHDNKGLASAWYLDKVLIVNDDTNKRWMFVCKQWFDDKQGDKKFVRTYTPSSKGITAYQVKVYTGTVRGAGTDANVLITLQGAKSKSAEIPLACGDNTNLFEEGNCDTFAVESPDLGDLVGLIIRHDNSGLGSDWFLDKVEVCDQGTGKWFIFSCGQWLDKSNGLSKSLKPTQTK